ncbi:GDSL esterase/lipase 7-like [Amaranthus tricolor]|uniref:GDSL esterase/lipase 7-like n=1 Tax=Amaranthus tricolor TaxID=29722 RepID=UPI0025862C5F|nr:GDSL esterase/lipase 7-like [Amaranthus tricolor]
MENRRMIIIITFLCLLLPEFNAVANVQSGVTTEPITPAFFIFGDSLIDNGNNNYLFSGAKANYYPYGIDVGGPSGRFSNGLTVVDYGARYLGLPLIPPYFSITSFGKHILRGINYASAAAGILEDTGRHYGQRTTLSGQISQFQETLALKLAPLFESQDAINQYLAKAVFLVDIGGNDYLNNYLQPERYDSSRLYSPESYADLLRDTLTAQVTRLYNLGARKFVLAGSGPLGCIPVYLSRSSDGNCMQNVNNLIIAYNNRLIEMKNTLNNSLPGSLFVYQNTYDLVNDMVHNPSTYGFTTSNKACCGNGKNGGELTCLPLQAPCPERDHYLFWDSFHPTQAANAIIARRGYSQYATDCTPISIYQLAQL